MKLTVKTLKNDKFQVDIDDAATVGQAKETIAAAKDFEAKGMKLIYAGKILGDAAVISTLNIKESEFVVVMAKNAAKKAAAPKEEPKAAAASADATNPVTTPAPAAADAPAAASTPSGDTPAPMETTATPSSDAAPSMGTPEQVEQITGMGFTSEQATEALRAAFGNSARAVEYLMNPGSMPTAAATPAASATPAAATPAADATPAAADGEGPGELAATSPLYPLLTNSSFVQLRHFVQRQPHLLPSLLQELAREQPELVRLLNDNREDFYRLLNTPVGGGGGGGGGGAPRGFHQIRVTQEEVEAIDRLVTVTGQPKEVVTEAFFACDKNEELAANYLLNHAFGN